MKRMPQHIVAVTGLVTHASGAVLMIQSPARGWEFPGGQVEEGEPLLEALRREIREETGVEVNVGALSGIYNNIKLPPKLILGFMCEYVSGDLTPSPESAAVEWVARDRALARVTHPAIYERVRDMLAFDGQPVCCVYTTDPYVIIERRFL